MCCLTSSVVLGGMRRVEYQLAVWELNAAGGGFKVLNGCLEKMSRMFMINSSDASPGHRADTQGQRDWP